MTTTAEQRRQPEFLQAAKAALGLTWDGLASRQGIAARALKNYRMPTESQNHRGMPALARHAVKQLLEAHEKKHREKAVRHGAR